MVLPDVFWDRMIFMALGCILGFVLGLLIKVDREAKEACREVKEVHNEVHEFIEEQHKKEEDGEARWHTIVILVCVILVAYAAIASQIALNESNHQGDCTQRTIVKNLDTQNERSTYTVASVNANKDLQIAQANYIELVLKPNATIEQMRAALTVYFDALTKFTTVATANAQKLEQNPLPSSTAYKECLSE
jgi:cytoskeletal protein RodZ